MQCCLLTSRPAGRYDFHQPQLGERMQPSPYPGLSSLRSEPHTERDNGYKVFSICLLNYCTRHSTTRIWFCRYLFLSFLQVLDRRPTLPGLQECRERGRVASAHAGRSESAERNGFGRICCISISKSRGTSKNYVLSNKIRVQGCCLYRGGSRLR